MGLVEQRKRYEEARELLDMRAQLGELDTSRAARVAIERIEAAMGALDDCIEMEPETVWGRRAGETRAVCERLLAQMRADLADLRTRRDPFEVVWPQVREWLDAEPDRTAEELLRRLQYETPGTFADGQLRTLQRRVKEWRREAVRNLVFSEPESKLRCEKPTEVTTGAVASE